MRSHPEIGERAALILVYLCFCFTVNFSIVFALLLTAVCRDDFDSKHSRSIQVEVNEGESVVLNCTHDVHFLANAAKWNKGGKSIHSSTRYYVHTRNSSLLIRTVSIDDEGQYTCERNATGGRLVSNVINLTVREKLRFFPIPTNRKLELGSFSKVHCKARSFLRPSIKWIKEGAREEEWPSHLRVENGTLFFDDVKSEDSGKYTCIASDGKETINATIQIDIIVSPKFVVLPSSLKVFEGEYVTFDCVAEGDPKPTIHWDKDNSLNSFDSPRFVFYSNGTLFINGTLPEDEGKYGCTAGNSGGFKRTEVTLDVYPANYGFDSSNVVDERKMTETVTITLGAAALYMGLVLMLMIWCRYRRAKKKARNLSQAFPEAKRENGDVEMNDFKGRKDSSEQHKLLSANEKSQKDGKKNDEEHSQASSSHSSKRSKSPYDKLQYPKQELQTIMLLGHGEFGDVYLAKAPNLKEGETESIVMVKALLSKDESINADFRRELEMFHKLNHDRIAKLIGICRDSDSFLILLEYSDWGDLKQFLLATRKENTRRGLKPNPLSISEIIVISHQIALGMEHLTDNRFVHKDLATRNCLITSNLDVKISSTSLSKDTYSAEYVNYRNRDIPIRWAPHEAVFEDEWSAKSDVWSYGVLIWEIFQQAELPYPDKSDDLVLRLLQSRQLQLIATSNTPPELQKILMSCWSDSPRQRPDFAQICKLLEDLRR
ncbi:inactive tyrosine-protein kinase 7-like protein [Dinothrombium tinctorium]|uniref:Inactive tyrosine-protein kinase 7-like protein n=1 Tax=Dinothrombium tinctorium TaxID=1965070 RepID=A0A443QRA8_9ACAR|nr:inactive tyrosine-protein kinase 7-like protein [Dinothrombium tinctorium]